MKKFLLYLLLICSCFVFCFSAETKFTEEEETSSANFPVSITAVTANILTSFEDPFEFAGDYGPEMNPTREKVFELVIPQNAPSIDFRELISPELYPLIQSPEVVAFLEQNASVNAYEFLRNCPNKLLQFDKKIRDLAARQGKLLDLSILSSTYPLEGSTAIELERHLHDQLIKEEMIALVGPLQVDDDKYQVFASPEGQVYFYWLYQSLNLHLIAKEPGLIDQINDIKTLFKDKFADPHQRATAFKNNLYKVSPDVLFTQEADALTANEITKSHRFFIPEGLIPDDGSLIFLNSSKWSVETQAIEVDNYPGYQWGKINLVLANYLPTGQKFLLASCHGNSTNPEDGRLQITLVKEKYLELIKLYPDLQLLIGTDANTKSEKDVHDLQAHLSSLGLIGTDVGPTTIKERMVTVQHKKSKRKAVDQEDFIITLKPDAGGKYCFSQMNVGFSGEPIDQGAPLPNQSNFSDHYPVKAVLTPNS